MTQQMTSRPYSTCLWLVGGLVGILLSAPMADGKSSQPSTVKPAACDYRAHPTISMVTPAQVKPGQKITISGKNFGTKQCFHSVSFGAKSTDAWTYVSTTTVEATVPNLLPGAIPVTVSTEGGTSQYQLQIQAK
jgi:hypothetical protein